MESLGNGRQVVDGGLDRSSVRECFRRPLDRWFRAGVIGLLGFMLLAASIVHAQSTRYVYDANGRVVAVTANNGTSVQYGYNTLGQAGLVSAPLSSGQLAIFAFAPTHGVAGAQVAINGQGFSTTPAGNTVSFNGTAATVLSASATQLIATVPNGATTGPIGITVGGQTVSSATSFVIDDTGAPPSITQVSPLVVATGGTVTVTGTHLDPVAGDTAVQMGDVNVLSLSSVSDTQLQYSVPSNAVSGRITVQTPYGTATSAPVAILPSNIVSAASGASTTYLATNGSVVSFSNNVAGKLGVLTFDARQGDNLELTLNGLTIAGSSATAIVVNVYNSAGTSIIASQTCYTTNPGASCRLALPNLAAGTYSAVITPADANSIFSLNAMVKTDIIGPALVTNTATTVNLAAGEVERFTFNANAGDTVALQLSGVTTTPAGQNMYVQVYPPGVVPAANTLYTIFNTSSTTTANLTNLPASGTYTAIVSIIPGTPGSAQLTLASSVKGTEVDNGTVQSYRTNIGGENVYLTFTANQGDNLELTFNGITITGSNSTEMGANVYGPSGAQVMSYACYTTNPGASCRLPLGNLAAGTYSVVVSPIDATSVISFNAILEPDTIGPALTLNAPTTVNLAAGEVERFTFNANAGDTVALQLSGVNTTPAGQNMYVQVYTPGSLPGGNTYAFFYTTSTTTANLPNLPVSGTYTAIVSIIPGTPGSAQLTLASGVTGTEVDSGTAQSYQTSVAGENVYLTFAANQGDDLELTFNGITITGSNSTQMTANVYGPSGAQVMSYACYTTNPGASCRLPLGNLAAGTYSVVVSPPDANSVIRFNAILMPDTIGPQLALNVPTTVNLAAGEVERFTFTANAGDTVALQLSGVNTTPAGQNMYVQVYTPGSLPGGSTYALFYTTGTTTENLPNVPASGTYTAIVSIIPGTPGSAQLTLTSQ
ncbi:IPT/TIG domain-containing protein [Burkholderia pseudomallei]|uniref:IPT/TIG domain-containing protein n=1 Tax=Burkholderia pseudomallei TaxID=28450 RepID=UPI000F079847|nr:IPT/TIG domain-containing protein [Burkholderia pseudomallei]VBF49834.1 YD repeat (two copies) [Burkholderia pseudomallei]VBQ49593.1 YD repeat (two copies) [Burkholderia pseudomallei]